MALAENCTHVNKKAWCFLFSSLLLNNSENFYALFSILIMKHKWLNPELIFSGRIRLHFCPISDLQQRI